MERDNDSGPKEFHCPNCGAALPPPDAPSIRCQYCGTVVLVPPEYLPHEEPKEVNLQPLVVNLAGLETTRVQRNTNPLFGLIGIIVVLVTVCGIGGAILSATGAITTSAIFGSALQSASKQGNLTTPTSTTRKQIAIASPTPVLPIHVDLLFGGEGSGPGQFNDARYIATDRDGNLFVGDYSDARIQKFDPQGKFIQLINLEPDRNGNTILRDMSADYRGNLYAVRGGDMLVYNMADGLLMNTLPGRFPDLIHDMVVADPANNLYAVGTGNGESLLKYDPSGNMLWVKDPVLEGIVPRNQPSGVHDLAVDGLGNSFILNQHGYEIYKFDSQGTFLDRFGSKGKETQQLSSPGPIAVDGKGRIFILDNIQGYVLKVFDNNGSFLKVIEWPDELTFPRTLVFDPNGFLYTVTNTNQAARMELLPDVFDE